ncbi:MAG: hypothetical protein P4L00_00895 [Candidatus Acidoferrales bacterium]|nr:hypothetical protein [Candidatus Acidoferrales bacterium]
MPTQKSAGNRATNSSAGASAKLSRKPAPKPARKRSAKSKHIAARSANSGSTEALSPNSSDKKSKLRHRRRQPSLERLPIDEALRREGMGESEYAKSLGTLMDTLEDPESDPKLRLEGLKEWARHFQTKRAPESAAANDVPVIVQLVHEVRRPVRPPIEIPAPPPPPESGA